MKIWKTLTCFSLVVAFAFFASITKVEAVETNTGGSASYGLSLQSGASDAVLDNNGVDPSSSSGVAAEAAIVVGAPWVSFGWGSGAPVVSFDTFQFTAAGPVQVQVTDDFLTGDRFEVYDSGTLIGTTSVSAGGGAGAVGPDAAFADPDYSSGSFSLGVGAHNISITVIDNPFGSGSAYIQVVSGGGGGATTFDLSPGTGTPPGTLCGVSMIPVPAGAPACTGAVPPLVTPGGPLDIDPQDSGSSPRCIGSGWATWSHDYVGDVFYTGGAMSQTITCPPGTTRLRFYVEPNPHSVQTFSVVADGTSSGSFTADGAGGAAYVGVCNDSGIGSVVINCDADFASGEYAVAGGSGGTCAGVDLSYSGGSLTMNLTVGPPEAGTWNVFLSLADVVVPLLSIPLPALDPPLAIPLTFPFADFGGIGVLTTFTTADDGIICSDWDTVDTSP